jgi:hypothetical protein
MKSRTMKRTNLNLASRSFRPVADAVLITALCYLTLILAEVKSPLLAWLTNSDQLTIPSFVIDLERSLSNYVGWNLPRAPCPACSSMISAYGFYFRSSPK